MHSLPSSLSFGSFLVYPSPGKSPEFARYKAAVLGIKEDRVRAEGERWPDYAATGLALKLTGSALERFFDGEPWLVPIPGSGLQSKDGHWPTKRICEALVGQGIGARVDSTLSRQSAMRKSAGSPNRPSPLEHYNSFAPVLPVRASTIILVDDVVTRGSTALGAAWRILDAMPTVNIKLFAMARTVLDGEVRGLVDLVVGTIEQTSSNFLKRTP